MNKKKSYFFKKTEDNKIAEFNLSMLTVNNLEDMDYCRKTKSIHDSSEKEDEFSEIIEIGDLGKSGKK